MRRRESVSFIIAILLIVFYIFSAFAVYADEVSEAAGGKSGSDILGKIIWIVIAAGVVFIIYLLIMIPRKKSKIYISGVKYRRSPYKKSKKRIAQTHYYSYKRNKYDK